MVEELFVEYLLLDTHELGEAQFIVFDKELESLKVLLHDRVNEGIQDFVADGSLERFEPFKLELFAIIGF